MLAIKELQTVTQTITDPAEWDGSLFGTQLELVQLAGVEFRSSQTVTDLGDGVKLLRLTVNQPISVRSRPLSLRYVATLFDQSHGGHFAGAAIERGRLLIMPPDFDFDACVKDSSFACSTLFVPPEQCRSWYQTIVGEEVEPMECLNMSTPAPDATRWIAAWPQLIANLDALSQQQRKNIQESLRDSAMTLLVHSLQASSVTEISDSDILGNESRLAKARMLVRLAEDYANSHPDLSIRMVDLCRVTRVSERTLQYAFQTCLGISPMNYLKRHRLHQVRRELKTANPDKTTVSAIACQFGFFHFGDFSRAFKSQFDESPLRTLRQT